LIRAVILGAALAAQAAGFAAQPAPQEDPRELERRIDRLKRELDTAQTAAADAADALRAAETAISAAHRRLHELAAERTKIQAELARLDAESSALRTGLDARHGQLVQLVRAAYMEGERSWLRLLLSGEDPERIERALVYRGYLARAQAHAIARLRADVERLSTLEAATREQAAALSSVEAETQLEHEALRAQVAERRRVLSRAAEQIRRSRRDLTKAQLDAARLARLAREIVLSEPSGRGAEDGGAPAVGAFGRFKGRLPAPVRGAIAASSGRGSTINPLSKGVFIRAPEGADVRAVAPGRVVFADWLRGYGNLLILDHGDGYLSIYGYNESVLKRVGEAVHGGDAVATVGASGGNDTSGLYFELRYQGQAFDPLPWLQAN